MEVIDVDAVHGAREALRRAIAESLHDDLSKTYQANQSNKAYSPDAESAGRRSLKNIALAYLSKMEDTESLDLVRSQYYDADNMTDIVGALGLLVNLDVPDRKKALENYFDRFQRDGLVIEKWLSLQAMSTLPGTLETVKSLMGHEAFSIRNPNKVRALIGAFVMGNPTGFHAADGSGYEFLGDRVIDLDALNPHIAARMIPPLGRWRRFDAARQVLMKAELTRILDTTGLSSDTYELATKSLV
jgi:aminopeptidase N